MNGPGEVKVEEKREEISASEAADVSMQSEVAAVPFFYITDVLKESPAAAAGLKLGDAVVKFGELRRENTEEDPITEIVQNV